MTAPAPQLGAGGARALRRLWLAAALPGLLLGLFAGPARADVEAGWRAYLAGDYTAAVREIRPAAEAGDAQAQFYLGTLSEHGAGVAKDYRAALDWYERAAVQGHTGARFAAGLLHYNGAGQGAVPQNDARAAELLEAAAAGGNAMAQHLIGKMYRLGRGVEADREKAIEWSLTAAQRGVPGAQHEMGVLIASQPHDRAERVAAYAWFLLAERAGHPGARENMEELARDMHAVDLEQAREIAEAWEPVDDAWRPQQ